MDVRGDACVLVRVVGASIAELVGAEVTEQHCQGLLALACANVILVGLVGLLRSQVIVVQCCHLLKSLN